ncbi:uncharacterized protein EV420DRAFT_1272688 [Desarmillaria tabescens]|uniref:DUF6589 domain-containing protein n=1 Tax=Armillaria tabescens TaxID=1929756 RepID=A0AA39N2S5_ARMTA|nr:uncharacterized protein EV420DRAFT_1272688 [Desarmillaria tabescens]KAK0455373.1 hypothetical protein EV420DRAFT_1272688 [Desarmillaria tabescens]
MPDHPKTHLSATAATFVPFIDVDRTKDLQFTEELQETSEYNIHVPPNDPQIYKPRIDDILPTSPLTGSSTKDMQSLYEAFAWHVCSILIEFRGVGFAKFKTKLGMPGSVQSLPVRKTANHPGHAMHADKSTYDGTWEVFVNLAKQRDWTDEELKRFIELIHGDLATREQYEGLQRMQVIEKSAKNHLDFVVFVLGLFHLKMAAANAYWRIHMEPKPDRDEPVGLFEYINYLRPKATAEFAAKNGPGFRSMHEIIYHATWTDILECWHVEAKKRQGIQTLEDFAQLNPTWDDIVSMSTSIVDNYLPSQDFGDEYERDKTRRDTVFENLHL